MVLLALECILIVSYMYKSVLLGLAAWLAICLIQFRDKDNAIDFWVRLIILSLPISYLEISCEIGFHIFKWYNFALLGFCVTLIYAIIKRRVDISKKAFFPLFVVLIIQLLRNLITEDPYSAFVELAQEYLTVWTVFLFWNYKKTQDRSEETGAELQRRCAEWEDIYLKVVFASALCVLYQSFVYMSTGTVIGRMTIWGGRYSFDMTFTGYSVLSAFLGGGMIIALKKILEKKNILFSFVQFVLISLSCAINSSRSGLISAIVIIAVMIFLALREKRTAKIALLSSAPVAGGLIYATYYLVRNRASLQGGNLLFGNGRLELLQTAFELMFGSTGAFLFGMGINASSVSKINAQHNMFLEFWTLNGTLLMIPFVALVCYVLWETRRRRNKYLLWQLLLGHQFFSSFFATTFLPVVLILAIGSANEKRAPQGELLQDKRPCVDRTDPC